MVDASVHAALVVVFVALLRALAASLGFDVTEDLLNEVATIIVGYILSLGGLALFRRARTRPGITIDDGGYKPPFT